MVLHIPDGYLFTLLAQFKEIFGERMISFDDISITIGQRNDRNDHLSIGYLCTPLLTLVDKIVTKMEVLAPKSFNRTRERIFRSYYPTGSFTEETADKITTNLSWNYVHEDNPYPVDNEGLKLFDGTYEGLLRALAAIRGKGVALSDLHDSKHKKVLTRDDFYEFGLELLGDEIQAYDFMTKIRKGRGNDMRFQVFLEMKGVSSDIREKIKSIQYVVSEGSIIPEAQLILFLVRESIWDY